MQNPLQSLPMFNPAVPQGTFSRAFVKGAGSGAMMMGIFSGVLTAASWVGITALVGLSAPALPAALGMMGLGALATGLFSGITATSRAADNHRSASNASHPAHREPVRTPHTAMTIAPAMEQAIGTQTAWADRVSSGTSNRDRVGQILADKAMSDGDRAAAILRDREQSSALEGRA